MRIAVPTDTADGLDAMRSGHFGHCVYFTIVEVEDGAVKGVETVKNVDHDAVGCGGVIEHALGLNLDAIVVAGMGYPPYSRFTAGGVDVYIEQMSPTVGMVIDNYLRGSVARMGEDQACRHH